MTDSESPRDALNRSLTARPLSRDDFAASTLSGLAAAYSDANYIARQAYRIADAMIALRKLDGNPAP